MSRDSSHPRGEAPAPDHRVEFDPAKFTKSDIALLATLHNSKDRGVTPRDSQAAINSIDLDIAELVISAEYLHELGVINLDRQGSKELPSQRDCRLTYTGEPLAAAAADTICSDEAPAESLTQLQSEYLNQVERVTGKQLTCSDGRPIQHMTIRELSNITPGDNNGGQAGLSEFLN